MKQSEGIANLALALVKAQAEFRPIAKDSQNPDYRSAYASLDAIVDATRPILAKHGLALVQGTTTPESDVNNKVTGFTVETMLVHSSGEWLTSGVLMPVVGRMMKGGGRAEVDPQSAGSAISYGRRYGICALLSLTTGEDDDGRAAKSTGGARNRVAASAATSASAQQSGATAPLAAPEDFLMPMGRHRGLRLGGLDDMTLVSALEYCRGNGAKQHGTLIGKIEEVLESRRLAMADAK